MRGQIKNRLFKSRILDASGLRYGNITGTDVDMMFEINNSLWIFLELKYSDAPLPIGQALAYERTVDALRAAGKHALLVVATFYSGEGDLILHELPVRRIYCGRWKSVTHKTIRDVIDAALVAAGINPQTGKPNNAL